MSPKGEKYLLESTNFKVGKFWKCLVKKLRTSEEERDEPAGGNTQSNRVRRGKENHPALGGLIDPARAVGRSQSFKGQAQASERQAHRARKSPQSQMWKEVVALVGREAKLRKLAYLVKP